MIAMLATHAGEARARPRSSQPLHDQFSTATPMAPSSSFYYFGGKVIPRVEVVVVLWGSNVSSTASSQMGPFYQAVVASPYLDWLGEYDTAGVTPYDQQGSSNQHVYRGTYKGTVTITPASASSSVGDSTIASELEAKIASSVLPAPTIDSEGGVDTLYMVYFPPGTVIDDGQGGTSCNGGGGSSFCGYHSTFRMTVGSQTVSVPYGVIPSMDDYGCAQGCGGSSVLEDYTIASSHEMAEAITDAEIGVASGVGRPMAFYDTYSGEIGDICENTSGYTDTIGGFTVQKNWSQRLGKCIAQDPSLPLCGSQRPCRPCTSADNGGACNGATPVCETSTASAKQGQCVACASSSDCTSASAPVCDSSTDTCRGCESDAECGAGGVCDTTSHTCTVKTTPDAGASPSPTADGGASPSPKADGGAATPGKDGGADNADWGNSSGCSSSPERSGSLGPMAIALAISAGFARRRRDRRSRASRRAA